MYYDHKDYMMTITSVWVQSWMQVNNRFLKESTVQYDFLIQHILQLSNTFFKARFHCFGLADFNQLVTVINALVFDRLLFHSVAPGLEGGGILTYKRLMGIAAGWGPIFTTGLTMTGSHSQ